MDPIAPTPSVGINPMMASSTVRTGKRKNLLHHVIRKREAISDIALAQAPSPSVTWLKDWGGVWKQSYLLLQDGCHNSG